MQSQAIAIQPEADSVENLDFYRMRDDFVRAYKPVTAEEKLLVTQMARAWQHLNDIYELRSRLTAQKGLLGLFEEDFEKYRFLMRNLTEAERMWRHAGAEFQRARRRRDDLGSTRRASIATIPSLRPMPAPPAQTPTSAVPESNQNTPGLRRNDHGPQTPACQPESAPDAAGPVIGIGNPDPPPRALREFPETLAGDAGGSSRQVTATGSRPGSA
jgi:hypothetical protein